MKCIAVIYRLLSVSFGSYQGDAKCRVHREERLHKVHSQTLAHFDEGQIFVTLRLAGRGRVIWIPPGVQQSESVSSDMRVFQGTKLEFRWAQNENPNDMQTRIT